MTYHFTNMLMYRGCLLDEFLRTTANTPRESSPTLPVQRCVQAAIHMASFAAEIADDTTYNAVFWTTSYFTFCAISIIVVYLTLYRNVEDRAKLEELLERAMRGHKRLDQSTELEAQRLLEESRALARHPKQPLSNANASSNTAPFTVSTDPTQHDTIPDALAKNGPEQSASYAEFHGLDGNYNGNDMFHSLVCLSQTKPNCKSAQANTAQFDIGNFGNGDLDMIMDVGFDRSIFDLLEADHNRSTFN